MATKDATIAELTKQFESSSAVVLTEYRGLTVTELKELRRSLGESAHYAVAKNTLAKIAAKNAGIEGLEDSFTGPTAIAFVQGEVVDAAKALRDFAKDHPNLVIKSGYFDGNPITAEEVQKLASLENRETLLGKLAGALKASLFGAAYMFTAPAAKTVRTVEALREKQESAN